MILNITSAKNMVKLGTRRRFKIISLLPVSLLSESGRNLLYHILLFHLGDRQDEESTVSYTCDICQATLVGRSQLEEHMNEHILRMYPKVKSPFNWKKVLGKKWSGEGPSGSKKSKKNEKE